MSYEGLKFVGYGKEASPLRTNVGRNNKRCSTSHIENLRRLEIHGLGVGDLLGELANLVVELRYLRLRNSRIMDQPRHIS